MKFTFIEKKMAPSGSLRCLLYTSDAADEL